MSGPRFDPPPIRLTPETAWVLVRAFAPASRSREPSGALAPERVVERARRLHLAPRIAARHAELHGGLGLEDQVGAEAAGALTAARRAAAARDAQLGACALAVRRAAADLGVEVVLLKYAALRAVGVLAPGSRLAADVDFLVRPEDTKRLWAALLERGFGPTGQPDWEHQLPGLAHPRLGEVELHVHLPGVGSSLAGNAGSATLETLETAGALEATPDTEAEGTGTRVPARPVLLAHALVHGLVQHGRAPSSYPPWRSVSDWIDLGLGEGGETDVLEAALPWLRGSLGDEEAAAARELCRLLTAGRPEDLAGSSAGARLGRHLLAGVLDPVYARSLALGRLGPAPGAGTGGGGPLARTARTLAHALAPGRAELAHLYGPWRSAGGLLVRRVLRPLDLAGRGVLALAARLRLRFRGARPRSV